MHTRLGRIPLYLLLILSLLFSYPIGAKPLVLPPTPVIIDTDMGFDDWLALIVLLNDKQVAIKAITISGTGRVHAKPGVDAVRQLLATLGHASIPVGIGSETPTCEQFEFLSIIRREADGRAKRLTDAGVLAPLKENFKVVPAVTLLNKTLKASPVPITILSLAPLTNIAQLIQQYPDVQAKIQDIYVMGGAIDVKGNLFIPRFNENPANDDAEWNIFVDACAADTVFSSQVRTNIFPLDSIRSVKASAEFVKDLKQHPNFSNSKGLQVFQAVLTDVKKSPLFGGELHLWDVVPALAVGEAPSWLGYENVRLHVHTNPQDRKRFGITRGSVQLTENTDRVGKTLDEDGFFDRLHEVLNELQ